MDEPEPVRDEIMELLVTLVGKREALKKRPADSILDVVRLERAITRQAELVLGYGRRQTVVTMRFLTHK